ncbi:hypothetical protein BDV39DRAFT_206939 [Aspergillus sergii]|uniref:Uncharacterized protein n=1 Tax=Aspergillus sergii TaxID=1034303 RepID=A0A5N6X1C9_9EURO|nr:hypothetical protein BDV39DRAFT_206939 [Aspergillus sergii]
MFDTATAYLPLATGWGWNPECSNIFHMVNDMLMAFHPNFSKDMLKDHPCMPAEYELWFDGRKHNYNRPNGHSTETWIGPLASPTNVPNITVASTTVKYQSRTLSAYCPPGYTLQNDVPIDSPTIYPVCSSAIQPRTPITYMASNTKGWTPETVRYTQATNIYAAPVLGWNINHSGAGPVTVTATATSTFDATSPTSKSSTSTHAPAPIPGSNATSPGAKVAIGVGITVAIMGVMVGAFLVYSRVKRHIERGIATIPRPWRDGREPSEFEVSLHSPGGTPQPLAELSAVRDLAEMEG